MKLLVAALLVSLSASAFGGTPIQVGVLVDALTSSHGAPTRVIETRDGTLLFYGPTLVFVTNGVIGFVSVGSATAPSEPFIADARSLPAAPRPTAPPPHAVAPWEIIASAEPDADVPEQERLKRLATRAKRCALTKSYASMDYAFCRALPLAFDIAPDCIFGMKDARGHALPAYGDTAWTAWYESGVALNAVVLAE